MPTQRRGQAGSRRFVRLAMLVLSLMMLRVGAAAAQSCGPVPVTSPTQTTGPIAVKKSDETCDVPSGGYIKTGVGYKLHAQSILTGSCQNRTLFLGQCVNVGQVNERYHGAVTTAVDGVPDGSLPVTQGKKDMNTTTTPPLNTTGGEPWSTSVLGTHTYTAEGTASAGPCGFLATWPATNSITMHAVACKPEWNLAGNPSVNTHLPATTISVYVAANMWDRMVGVDSTGPAAQAVFNWNTQLDGVGVEFQIVDVACGSGGDCIEMQTTSDTILGCADFAPTSINLSTGEIQAKSALRFPSETWDDATDDRLRRTVAHELGHALGLNHNTCSTANSLMGTATSCTSLDTGMALSATTTDLLPMTKSTYGDHVRVACGF